MQQLSLTTASMILAQGFPKSSKTAIRGSSTPRGSMNWWLQATICRDTFHALPAPCQDHLHSERSDRSAPRRSFSKLQFNVEPVGMVTWLVYSSMYVRTYVCMYVCPMYVCRYVRTDVCTSVRMYVGTYACIHVCRYVGRQLDHVLIYAFVHAWFLEFLSIDILDRVDVICLIICVLVMPLS